MMCRLAISAGWLVASLSPALAIDPPQVWRDPDTGCAYLVTPQGGVAPRYRRNGSPDCPDAGSSIVDDTTRGLSQGLDALRRELDRLRESFRDRPPPERL